MKKETGNRVKQSFIAGSLASSAGVFISKLIGLFYVVPFRAIVGQENMAYYTAAYTFYNVLLQICSAGLPFAIAAIIAKYVNRNDFRTVILVRRLSTAILMVSGFVMALIFILISKPLAMMSLGSMASDTEIRIMQNTFSILALALFLVPVLYSYRGYYQGMKELKLYADSQVIEQLARVLSLLGIGWFLVYVVKLAPIFGIYAAVFATSIGCVFAMMYFMYFDKKNYKKIVKAARLQKEEPADRKMILIELVSMGLPYVLVSILGNSQVLVNTMFFNRLNTSFGMDLSTSKIIYSIIETNCDKLISIPQVLSIGFSAGIVPYMTVSMENRDRRGLNRNIEDCLDTVLYIALPICFSMCMLARPIYFIMYGASELDYGEICLRWDSLLGLMTTLTPICNSMMLTLKFRKESIVYLACGFVVKCVTFYPLMRYAGYIGAIISSCLCSATIIYLSLVKIKNRYDVRYGRIAVRVFKMVIGCLCMNGVYAIFKYFGITALASSRLLSLLQLGLMGICALAAYVFVTNLMKLPRAVFHMEIKDIVKRLAHR